MSVVSAEIEITEVPFGSAAYHEVTDLRRAILRTPLGLDFTPEELAREREDTHLAARMRDRVVGTLLLRAMDARTTRLMRMAVEEDMRGHSIGRRLVTHAEALLRNRGIETVMMHARESAAGFYERSGYARVGEEFLEQGIPHIRMEKRIA